MPVGTCVGEAVVVRWISMIPMPKPWSVVTNKSPFLSMATYSAAVVPTTLDWSFGAMKESTRFHTMFPSLSNATSNDLHVSRGSAVHSARGTFFMN